MVIQVRALEQGYGNDVAAAFMPFDGENSGLEGRH
jgi:hypothetical protein